MRAVRNLDDVQIVLRELLDWKTRMETRDIDLHQRRIRNSAPGVDDNDLVIVSQLPLIPDDNNVNEQPKTITFSTQGVVTTGELIPKFNVGKGMESIPHEVWVAVRGAPSGGDLLVQVALNNVNILTEPVKVPSGSLVTAYSTKIVQPQPTFGYQSAVWPVIVNGAGAQSVTVGIVIRRIIFKGAQVS